MKNALNKPILEYGSGFPTLLRKEIKRFYKVAFQTVAAPVLTAVLYLMIFGHLIVTSMSFMRHATLTCKEN